MIVEGLSSFAEWLTMGGATAREFSFWAVLFAVSVGIFLIVTMIQGRPRRPLDFALLFREFAIVAILVRSLLVIKWQLTPQIWGGFLFMLLLAAKVSIVAAILHERRMTDEDVDKLLAEDAIRRKQFRSNRDTKGLENSWVTPPS